MFVDIRSLLQAIFMIYGTIPYRENDAMKAYNIFHSTHYMQERLALIWGQQAQSFGLYVGPEPKEVFYFGGDHKPSNSSVLLN